MLKLSMAALACAGVITFGEPATAAPFSAAGSSLGAAAARTAMNNTAEEATPLLVRDRRGKRGWRHGWNRGHHYGWRNRYGWHRPHYVPRRHYGYYGPRHYGYGVAPGIRLYW